MVQSLLISNVTSLFSELYHQQHLCFSGEESPSEGTAFIFGKDIRTDPKAARCDVCKRNLFFYQFELLSITIL